MNIICRECNEPIPYTTSKKNNVIGYHYPKCFQKHVESYKEYGIRIGMRVHKK